MSEQLNSDNESPSPNPKENYPSALALDSVVQAQPLATLWLQGLRQLNFVRCLASLAFCFLWVKPSSAKNRFVLFDISLY